MTEKKVLPYDYTSPESIEEYSKELIGKSFYDIIKNYYKEDIDIIKEKVEYYNNPRGKGSLGNLVEELFFLYKPNNDSSADFVEAKVELKVTPYEINAKNKIRAGERLVITMIPYDRPIEDEFKSSHVREKIELILIILYLRNRSQQRVDQKINYSKLFSLFSQICEEDLKIITDDYKKIATKIRHGKAHELSEGDTLYLGACTKGATAEKSFATQYYNALDKAKKRAFCLKQSYMTHVINKYIVGDIATYEPIVKDVQLLKNQSFEEYILSKMDGYKGLTREKLLEELEICFDGEKLPKNIYSMIAFRMLGIKSNRADEFEKADIAVKTIRVEENGTIRESMSLPSYKALDFVEETYEESKVYEYFSQKRFLFVVFQKKNGVYYFKGAKFWNMKAEDLEGIGKYEWKWFQDIYKEGISFRITDSKVYNNLPSASQTTVFHIRPHEAKSAYLIKRINFKKGDIERHGDLLPNGDYMTTQCFWLNKSYVKQQIESLIK